MQTKKKLLREIKAFLRATKMSPGAFGKRSVQNSRLVRKLEEGGTISIDVADRVVSYMQAELAKRLEDKEKERPLLSA